jgi:tryptophan synthase alpha chain
MLGKVRASTSKPIAVGVGVSTPEHAQLVAQMAEGVVVGSAIMKLIEDLRGRKDMPLRVGDFVGELKAATRLTPVEPRLSAS